MEPLDYLKILQRHWKVVAGLVVLAIVAVFLVSPRSPDRVYEARHTLVRDQVSGGEGGGSAADNVAAVAMFATRGEVPARAAEKIGYDGTPEELAASVEATSDPEVGTVDIIAESNDPDEAVAIANAVADELVAFIDDRQAMEREAEAQQLQAREQEIIAELAQLPVVPGDPATAARRESLLNDLDTVDASQSDTPDPTRYITLDRAVNATTQEGLAVGVTRAQKVLIAVIVAAILGFGVAIMLDRSDQRLHTKQQAERQFGLPVLTEVPLLPVRIRHRAPVFGYQNDPRVAEAYRSLRTALLLFRDRLPLELEAAELAGQHLGKHSSASRQVIVVTSPDAGDGKSTTATNLAMAYAEAGQRVLLILWDLWRPLPARVLDAEDGPGVAEFLEVGNAPLVRFVQDTSVPGLQIVPAGRSGHQPGGQLDAELRLVEEARSLADVVIIDTAPILTASVTRELVTMADVVVLACRAGRTSSPAAQRCAELLERLGAPTLGVVLVGMPTGPFNDYYGAPSTNGRGGRLRNSVLERRAAGEFQSVSSGEHAPGSARRHYRYEGPGPDQGYDG